MSHLDRLASPHQIPLSPDIDFQGCKSKQSLLWAGQVSWNIFMDYSINDEGIIDLDDAVEFACQDSPQRKAFSSSEEESEDEEETCKKVYSSVIENTQDKIRKLKRVQKKLPELVNEVIIAKKKDDDWRELS